LTGKQKCSWLKSCLTRVRATSFNFFSVKIPLKEASLEEKIHHEVEKVDEEGRENEALYRNLFDFFDLEVKNFSKTW
jgi:hypothetical protein